MSAGDLPASTLPVVASLSCIDGHGSEAHQRVTASNVLLQFLLSVSSFAPNPQYRPILFPFLVSKPRPLPVQCALLPESWRPSAFF